MANYNSKPQVYGDFIAPYDMEMLAKAIKFRQTKYDVNKAKVEAAVDNIAGLQMAKSSDNEYLHNRVSTLLNQISEGQGAIDYSNNGLSDYITKYISNAVDDTVLTAYQSTMNLNANREQIDKWKREGDERYNVSNVNWFNESVNAYMNNDEIGQRFNTTYIPHVNVSKWYDSRIKFMKDNMSEQEYEIINPKNPWEKITKKVKNMDVGEIMNVLDAETPQEVRTQQMIDGHYRYRNGGDDIVKADYLEMLEGREKLVQNNLISLQGRLSVETNPEMRSNLENAISSTKQRLDRMERYKSEPADRLSMVSALEQNRYTTMVVGQMKSAMSESTKTELNKVYKAQLDYGIQQEKLQIEKFKATTARMKKNSDGSQDNGGNSENESGDRIISVASAITSKDLPTLSKSISNSYTETGQAVLAIHGKLLDIHKNDKEVNIGTEENPVMVNPFTHNYNNAVKKVVSEIGADVDRSTPEFIHSVVEVMHKEGHLSRGEYSDLYDAYNDYSYYKSVRESDDELIRRGLETTVVDKMAKEIFRDVADLKIIGKFGDDLSVDDYYNSLSNKEKGSIKEYSSGEIAKKFQSYLKGQKDQDGGLNNVFRKMAWSYNIGVETQRDGSINLFNPSDEDFKKLNNRLNSFNQINGTNHTLDELGLGARLIYPTDNKLLKIIAGGTQDDDIQNSVSIGYSEGATLVNAERVQNFKKNRADLKERATLSKVSRYSDDIETAIDIMGGVSHTEVYNSMGDLTARGAINVSGKPSSVLFKVDKKNSTDDANGMISMYVTYGENIDKFYKVPVTLDNMIANIQHFAKPTQSLIKDLAGGKQITTGFWAKLKVDGNSMKDGMSEDAIQEQLSTLSPESAKSVSRFLKNKDVNTITSKLKQGKDLYSDGRKYKVRNGTAELMEILMNNPDAITISKKSNYVNVSNSSTMGSRTEAKAEVTMSYKYTDGNGDKQVITEKAYLPEKMSYTSDKKLSELFTQQEKIAMVYDYGVSGNYYTDTEGNITYETKDDWVFYSNFMKKVMNTVPLRVVESK